MILPENPRFIDERYYDHIALITQTLPNDSPALGFSKGDTLVIDITLSPSQNCFVLAGSGDDETVYRYQKNPNESLLMSKFSMDELDDVIKGVIVAVYRE